MHNNRYSFAGPLKGLTDPETIHECTINGGDSGLVIIWSGNEYSRRKSWISADEDASLSLERMR